MSVYRVGLDKYYTQTLNAFTHTDIHSRTELNLVCGSLSNASFSNNLPISVASEGGLVTTRWNLPPESKDQVFVCAFVCGVYPPRVVTSQGGKIATIAPHAFVHHCGTRCNFPLLHCQECLLVFNLPKRNRCFHLKRTTCVATRFHLN